MSPVDPRVVAVVAAYAPPPELADRVRATLAQTAGVVVVDDGSPPGADAALEAARGAGATLVRLPANRGIAAALNAGIAEARAAGAEFVLLLDQDSRPADDYVVRALATWRDARAAGVRVGFVAAGSYGDAPAPTRGRVRGFVRAFDPMQSGMLVPLATLDAVGPLDESLVIDGVDSDLTARTRAAGLEPLVAPGARLEHALGRREPTLLRGRPLSVLGRPVTHNRHAPTRVYYITRNGTLLTMRHARRDPAWVARRLVEEAKAHGMRLVLGNERRATAAAMVAGFADAARGRRGRIPDALAARLARVGRRSEGRRGEGRPSD